MRLLLFFALTLIGFTSIGQSAFVDIVSSTGKYSFNYQQVPDPIISLYPLVNNPEYTFQWESSNSPDGVFTPTGNTNATLTFGSFLNETKYYRRLATKNNVTVKSNILRYEIVSIQWEDLNYMRVHSVLKPGQTTWQQVDQLPVGDKLVSTTYLDGLGRTVQTIDKEIATPVTGSNVWGDEVELFYYDQFGRKPYEYLPFPSYLNIGKFKNTEDEELSNYYLQKYNDQSPFSKSTYDESPLNRISVQNAPGDIWNQGPGTKNKYLLNDATDDVKRFTIGYGETDKPILSSTQPLYLINSLFKYESTDEQNKRVLSYVDDDGKLILKKVQLEDNASTGYTGWICTYYIYDDFGRLRCEINPEGVEWLRQNNWSFTGTNGNTVFYEQCFVFGYDFKGRTIYKKQPGQEYLRMVYDSRDRLVLTQDGNQRIKSPTPEWTAYLYDDLDRPTITTLYYTVSSLATLQNTASTGAPIVTTTQLNNTAICTPLKYLYYEGATFTGRLSFSAAIAAKAAVAPAGSNQMAITPTNRVIGFATGSRTRVLVSGTPFWLPSTTHYDDDGNVIQQITGNIKVSNDYVSIQYAWDGRTLATAHRHGLTTGVMNNFDIITRYTYDKIGRQTVTEQKYGTNAWRVMVNRNFDELGRTANKRLSPGFTGHFSGIGPAGGGLENLGYTYNIQGTLIGINKAYALKESGYNKWSNFFGMYLAYASNETETTNVRLNGQMAAQVWNTQGDDVQRRYNYKYDAAGRSYSVFAQKASSSWSSTELNFNEYAEYNSNGNILTLVRNGFKMGGTGIFINDFLTYDYQAYSNKLRNVTDESGNTINGTAGDFKDGTNGSADDYVFDANGNMVTDLNKEIKNLVGANGIKYNHLDKPEEIKIEGKGTIKITYDADGAKLKREFISATGGGTRITWYIGAYQYEEVTGGSNPQAFALSFISFGEGRIRPITAENTTNGGDAVYRTALLTLPGSKKGSIDYFITDHRSDVRMILTEETQYSYTTASMETANGRRGVEVNLFGDEVQNTELDINQIPGQSSGNGWNTNPSAFVSKLGGSGGPKVGPNQLLKVMAGDLITANVQYYYQNNVVNQSGSTVFNSVLSMLGGAILGSNTTSIVTKDASTAITGNLNTGTAFSQLIAPDITSPNGQLAKAYLNVVFFDERFTFVQDGSTSTRVGSSGAAATIALLNIKVPKNGYCLVYISNESDEPVYFDNMQVRHDRGRILEENHYYSYGLKIAALSSKAFGGAPNNYQYQGDFSEFDEDLGWNDFMLRSYDPQLGRFLQNDPYDQFASGYVGMGNDPGNIVDPTGGFSDPFSTLDMVEVVAKARPGAISKGMAIGLKITQTTVVSLRVAHVYNNADESASFRTYGSNDGSPKTFGGKQYNYSHSEVEAITQTVTININPPPVDLSPSGSTGQLLPPNGDIGGNIRAQLLKDVDAVAWRIYRNSNQYQLDHLVQRPIIEEWMPYKSDIQRNLSETPLMQESALMVLTGGAGNLLKAAKTSTNIKYLGRMEDLQDIPRSQTILDELPNLGNAKANYYQNMSVVRRNLREGVTFKDKSWFRPNSEPAPLLPQWPTRTIRQTFYGAERNLMQNRGLWPK